MECGLKPDREGVTETEFKDTDVADCVETNSDELGFSRDVTTSGSQGSRELLLHHLEQDHVEKPNRARMSLAAEDDGALTFTDTNSNSHKPLNRPGVILLGRGNSFSLGRSEIILLHNRPIGKRNQKGASQAQGENGLQSIDEQTTVPSSPPPISEDVALDLTSHTNGWHGMDTPENQVEDIDNSSKTTAMTTTTTSDSLHQLWRKAEKVMAARRGQVLKVLEAFGIGELGPDGGGDDDGQQQQQEEEEVWQIVQENFGRQQH